MNELEELKQLSLPLIEYLKETGNPYSKIIITTETVEVVVEVVTVEKFVPIK